MKRSELKSMAKEQIKGKIGLLFVMFLVMTGIMMVCGLTSIIGIGAIALFIVTPAFSLSLCQVYLALTKSEDIKVGDIFKGFDQTGRALWLYILTVIFTFLWSLLLVIPGIIKSYAYSMAFYVLADKPELTAREALKESKKIMKGHKFDLFVLQLSFFWWYILGSITFGLAYIYVIPYMSATTVNFYNSIKEENVEPITAE